MRNAIHDGATMDRANIEGEPGRVIGECRDLADGFRDLNHGICTELVLAAGVRTAPLSDYAIRGATFSCCNQSETLMVPGSPLEHEAGQRVGGN